LTCQALFQNPAGFSWPLANETSSVRLTGVINRVWQQDMFGRAEVAFSGHERKQFSPVMGLQVPGVRGQTAHVESPSVLEGID
jgi:hypothetical protein